MKSFKLLSCALLLLLAGKASATVQGFWRGEATPGRLKDSSFYGHSLTMNGTVPNPTSPTALDGVKILFQGTGVNTDNLKIPASAFNFAVTGKMSFYALIMAHDAVGDCPILSVTPSSGDYLDVVIDATGYLKARFNGGTSIGSTTLLTDGAWHLLRVTVGPLGTNFYIDGNVEIADNSATTMGSAAPLIYLGKASAVTATAAGGTYFDGVQMGDAISDAYSGPKLPLPTPTITSSITLTTTPTFTPTITSTITPTLTVTKTATPTSSVTVTSTLTVTQTITVTPAPTGFIFESLGKKVLNVNSQGTPVAAPVSPSSPSNSVSLTLTGSTSWTNTSCTCTAQPCEVIFWNQSTTETMLWWIDKSTSDPAFGGISMTAGSVPIPRPIVPGDVFHYKFTAATGNGFMQNRY